MRPWFLRAALYGSVLLLLLPPASAGKGGPREYLKKSEEWFAGEEAKRVAGHILSHQSELGGWPKNVDPPAAPFPGDRKTPRPPFDNDAPTDELRFLARVFTATKA